MGPGHLLKPREHGVRGLENHSNAYGPGLRLLEGTDAGSWLQFHGTQLGTSWAARQLPGREKAHEFAFGLLKTAVPRLLSQVKATCMNKADVRNSHELECIPETRFLCIPSLIG
jgi:hypothetical protein